MKKNRRVSAFLIFIILAVLGGIIAIIMFMSNRQAQREEFDKLINSEMLLKVDYGVVPREHKLQEKNAFLKKTEQDTNLYLYITKDNVLFTYYTDWFYNIDPLKGFVLEQKKNLTRKQSNAIISAIEEKRIEESYGETRDDYLAIRMDGKAYYIHKNDLQMALQENGFYYNYMTGDNYQGKVNKTKD